VPASTKGDRSIGDAQLELMDAIDTILLGRVTYRMFSQYWPNVSDAEEKPFADRLNAIPKLVFSKTLDRAPWGNWKEARVVRDDPAEEVAKLKQLPGRDMIVWGSLSIAQALMDGDLVDEYRLVVCPVALGDGRPLFRGVLDAGSLRLLEAKSFDRGAAQLKYQTQNVRSAERTEEREARSAARG
jgi:dihydrofolate reductase